VTDVDACRRFTAMYHEHHRRVFAYAVGRAGREHADDVVAETFLVAWRRLADVPANPLPWPLGVTRNVTHERYRAEVRRPPAGGAAARRRRTRVVAAGRRAGHRRRTGRAADYAGTPTVTYGQGFRAHLLTRNP